MKIEKKKVYFNDKRGEIADIIYKEPYDAVTVITSKKGAVRGNHYHKETIQSVYLHSGKLESLTRKIGDKKIKHTIVKPGELLTTEENEEHALIALKDSVFYVFTRGPRSGIDYEKDTYRLAKPLRTAN